MTGPQRPRFAHHDPEGWVDAVLGAQRWLRRLRHTIEDASDESADRWADSHPLVDALIGIVALSRSVDRAVNVLDVAPAACSPVERVAEDVLR